MTDRTIIHYDLDAFFVSVECLLDSRIKGRPILIGGNGGRSVVSSCSYEARRFGVHSAMPMNLAKKLCPDALVIGGDFENYSKYSKMVTAIIGEQVPLFEKASIDEFYVDMTGMDRFHDVFHIASSIRSTVMKETGLPISMGCSVNKMVAKVATGEAKPDGEKVVPEQQIHPFLDPMPVRKIPMLGEKTARFLHDMGVNRVKTLREVPLHILQTVFGKNGLTLYNRARGIDKSLVTPYVEQKSMSAENTFLTDTIDAPHLKNVLTAMVEKLAFKLRKKSQLTACITVKIRYSDFETTTKQVKIPLTASDKDLLKHCHVLFDKLYTRRVLVRLIGVRFSKLAYGSQQITLFDDTIEELALAKAMDKIKSKFGTSKLMRASTFDINDQVRKDNNIFKG